MAMKVDSLEERIKLKAHVQLRAEIDAAGKELEQYMRTGYAMELEKLFFQEKDNKPKNATVYGAFQEIKDRIFKELISQREDNAIRDFISKVDELQAQIDELKTP